MSPSSESLREVRAGRWRPDSPRCRAGRSRPAAHSAVRRHLDDPQSRRRPACVVRVATQRRRPAERDEEPASGRSGVDEVRRGVRRERAVQRHGPDVSSRARVEELATSAWRSITQSTRPSAVAAIPRESLMPLFENSGSGAGSAEPRGRGMAAAHPRVCVTRRATRIQRPTYQRGARGSLADSPRTVATDGARRRHNAWHGRTHHRRVVTRQANVAALRHDAG